MKFESEKSPISVATASRFRKADPREKGFERHSAQLAGEASFYGELVGRLAERDRAAAAEHLAIIKAESRSDSKE